MGRFWVCLFILFATGAQAGFADGNRLQDWCESDRATLAGYVAGVVDQHDADFSIGLREEDRIKTSGAGGSETTTAVTFEILGNLCAPDRAILKQYLDITCKYLGQHPEKRQLEAAALVKYALADAWPCLK